MHPLTNNLALVLPGSPVDCLDDLIAEDGQFAAAVAQVVGHGSGGFGFKLRQFRIGKSRKLAVYRRSPVPKFVGPERRDTVHRNPPRDSGTSNAHEPGQLGGCAKDFDDVICSHDRQFKAVNSHPSTTLSDAARSLAYMSTLPERMQLILDDLQLSPAAFSRLVGVTTASVSFWINGRSAPSAETLFSIADRTGYSARWIATGQGQPKKEQETMPLRMQLKESEYDLLVLFQSLPEQLQHKLIGYAKGLADSVYSDTSIVHLKRGASG